MRKNTNMKKLLITGFDPFGGEVINPSWEAVASLPDKIGNFELYKAQLPTVFGKASRRAIEIAERLSPDAILCVGQAGGRANVTPEVVAINLMEARIADNEGNAPVDTPIVRDAPAAYFSTLPVRRIVDELSKKGFPTALSFSAGAFVCNELLYSLLHRFRDTDIPIGFIHIPYLPEQATNGQPSLPQERAVAALALAIESL